MTDNAPFDPGTFSGEQIAGQRLMVGFEGVEMNADLHFLIDKLKVGGLILFSANIVSPGQIEKLCTEAQMFARSCGQPPLFIAIDQEGGQVARLKEPFTIFPGNPHIKDTADAEHFAKVTAWELLSVGVNMNMAPVLDVAPRQTGSIMAQRAFGNDPQWVADMGARVIDHLQSSGVMAVAKHFPGIGRTTLDSHIDLPRLDADLADIEAVDLPPFAAAIRHKVAGFMLSHILYPQIDREWPASLSPKIARDLLRKQMGYKGVVMTDDLDMGAITKHYGVLTAVEQILDAEVDLALVCHAGPSIEATFEKILQVQKDLAEMREKGSQSVERILALKAKYLD